MTQIKRTFYFLNDGRKTKSGSVMSFTPTNEDQYGNGTEGFVDELTLEKIVELLNQQSLEIERKEKVLESYQEIRDKIGDRFYDYCKSHGGIYS